MKTDLEIELNIQMPDAFPLPEEQYLLVGKIQKYRTCNIKSTSLPNTVQEEPSLNILEAWDYFAKLKEQRCWKT